MRGFAKPFGGFVASLCLCAGAALGSEGIELQKSKTPSLLLNDFVTALSAYGDGQSAKAAMTEPERIWMEALAKRGVDPEFVRQRLQGALGSKSDFLKQFRTVTREDVRASKRAVTDAVPVSLHAYRLDVLEDYDDFMNDDVYTYYITTHGGIVWGKVSEIYKNLDEGTATFLSAEDRPLFGPSGEQLVPESHLIVDIGIVESDGDDVKELQKLSDVIVDLAVVALAVYNPQAGLAAAQARAETKNLLHMIIAMDKDDRLAVDSLYFTSDNIAQRFNGAETVTEFSRSYKRETFWTSFDYRLSFRFLR